MYYTEGEKYPRRFEMKRTGSYGTREQSDMERWPGPTVRISSAKLTSALLPRPPGVASGGAVGSAARPEVRRHSTGPASGPAALHVHPLGLPWRLLLLLRRWLLLLLWWGLPHGWGLLTHGILVRLLVQLLVQLLLRLRLLLRWRLLWWLLLLLHHHLLPLEPRKLVLVRVRVRDAVRVRVRVSVRVSVRVRVRGWDW